MEQKLIFLDIDGTLTQPGRNTPPDSALEAVARARANGHKVALCSGRNYGMLRPLLRFGFDGFAASAGGYIQCGDQVVFDCPLTPAQQALALEALDREGIFLTVEGRDSTYTDEGLKDFLRAQDRRTGGSELLRWREQLERELGIRPMGEYQGEPIYKIVFLCQSRKELEEPRGLLEEEFAFCIQEETASGAVNGELINRAFHKGRAVERLSAHFGIPIQNTIAFGDSMNDWEMLQSAGLGICMGGGSPRLKEIAGEVCPPVEEDGLYRAFVRHGLI